MSSTIRETIELETRSPREIIDVTEQVEAAISGAPSGSCHLFLKHTTAGLMVVTNEPGVADDIMDILSGLTPMKSYRHASQAHVAAHFLSALAGSSLTVPLRDGKLSLGKFQRIVLVEFEGPRHRKIEVRLLATG